ncbi:hypothetical protein [Mycolicibacterium conceptionense]|uniref:hypothetical protein n=1 Tax=Mycolicibacterium conceptionense TaxID=451644 RepID=UPI000AC138B8|nr:hypothetical protein [Mycolicibacterium conceptionense]
MSAPYPAILVRGASSLPCDTRSDQFGGVAVVRVLWALSVICFLAAGVLLAVSLWPAPRAELTETPQPSAEQLQVQQIVTDWIEAAERGDVETVRRLTCSEPTGTIARDFNEYITDPNGYGVERHTHIDGFFRYTKTRDGAQIDVMHRDIGLTDLGRQHAATAANNVFGETYVLVNEDGQLKVCGAI